MPLSSVLSDLRGLLENAVSILTEPPQQASTEFFSPPSIPTLCLFFSQARFVSVPLGVSRRVGLSLRQAQESHGSLS